MITPSQGAHLVLDKSFLSGHTAIMVPHTRDGRVMFAIPWHGHTLVGTTDTPVAQASLEPVPLDQEIEFMLDTASLYLEKKPTRADILSVFAGIRPLVKSGGSKNTAALSRDHTIHIDRSGLVSITGGKWTTYRNMAEDCVDQAATLARVTERPSVTRHLKIHGSHQNARRFGPLAVYGSDAPFIQKLIRADATLGEPLHPALPYGGAEVLWAVREEMARTVEDVLARRTRALFLNAGAAALMAPRVAQLMAQELGRDTSWQDEQNLQFQKLAKGYQVDNL
jgi:glycerol-3-phosphate dehydrogenase